MVEMEDLTSDFYDVEMIPFKASANNKTGITFKGSSVEYLNAHKNILELVKRKGERYVINGIEIGIVDNPENKPICVDIKPKTGLSGKVNLSVFCVNDKGSATIMVNKKAGGGILHVKTLGIKIIKYLLDNFCTGMLNLEDIEILKKKNKPENKTYTCQNCDKIFQSKQGLNLHIRRAHKGSLITCDACPKTFVVKTDLSQHIQETHNEIISPDAKKLRKSESVKEELKLENEDIKGNVQDELIILESESWEEKRFAHRKAEVQVNVEEENSMKEYEKEERSEKVKNTAKELSKLQDEKVIKKQMNWDNEHKEFKEKMVKAKVEEVRLSVRQKKNRKRTRKNLTIKDDGGTNVDASKDAIDQIDVTVTDKHRFRPTRYSSENGMGPGYVGWRDDMEDLKVAFNNLKKENEELKIEKENLAKQVREMENTDDTESGKSFKKLRMEFKRLKEDFLECMDAVERETYARAKAEAIAKTLKDTLEAKSIVEDQTMEIDDQPEKVEPSTEEWTVERRTSKNKKQGEKYHECKICNFCYESEAELRKHTKTHTVNKLNCIQCQETFSTDTDFKKHKDSHTSAESPVSSECEESIQNKAVLNRHEESHTAGTSREQIKCSRCNIIFQELNELNRHLNQICTKCLETFCNATELKKHEEKHVTVKSFECDFCEEIYQTPGELKNHLGSHTSVRTEINDMKCKQCNVIFQHEHELKKHLETHATDTRTFGVKCSKCDKIYSTMSKLRRHDWRSHRCVECTICGEEVPSREDISEHRRSKHDITTRSVCKFFPNCIDEDECFFVHRINNTETENIDSCPRGENCQDQTCTFSEWKHKSKVTLCKFQTQCTRINCPYKHIAKRKAFLGQGNSNCDPK